MTNLKTIFKQKSKLLLIVLSLLGMLFSYSCSCRNNSTAPNTPENNDTKVPFSASADAMNNHLDLYVKSDNKTNSVVIIKFKSEQNINSAKITSIKHKSGTEVGLTTEQLSYNLQTSELELGANENTRKAIASKLTTEGETSVITLTIELTSNDEKLQNTTTTVDVDVNLIKATKLSYDKMHTDIFKNIASGAGIIFDGARVFTFASGATYKNDEITVINSGADADDNTTITPTEFINKIEGATYLGAKSDIYSSAKATYNSLADTKATFFIDFTFNPKYEPVGTQIKLHVDAKSSANGKGKWDTGTTK